MSVVLKQAEAYAAKVAERVLRIASLEVQNCDAADFHEVHVTALRQSLKLAYVEGYVAALENELRRGALQTEAAMSPAGMQFERLGRQLSEGEAND